MRIKRLVPFIKVFYGRINAFIAQYGIQVIRGAFAPAAGVAGSNFAGKCYDFAFSTASYYCNILVLIAFHFCMGDQPGELF